MRKKIISVALITSFLFSGCALNAGNNPDKYIQLGQYKNLNVTRVSTDVTEEDIENELNESIDSYLEPVKVLDRDTVEMRVYERGTGETLACGTGSCATVVAAIDSPSNVASSSAFAIPAPNETIANTDKVAIIFFISIVFSPIIYILTIKYYILFFALSKIKYSI